MPDDLAPQRQRVRLAGEGESDVEQVAELDRQRRLHQQALARDVDGQPSHASSPRRRVTGSSASTRV